MMGVREMLIILRARDEASRVFRQTAGNMSTLTTAQKEAAMKNLAMGSSLISVGTAIGAVGAAGLYMFGKATASAVDYSRQVALTKTQVDQAGVSLASLGQIGVAVAQQIAVPFDQTQTTLYDIFSSMDVNLPQAQMLLKNFGKAAVAGQVDLQTASRATIAILNSYHMAAGRVNDVNDMMFQLVRKGVGTYDEFASSIGRAIPSAVRAGQSFKTLAGMMSFLTRNGLSTSMAASSAARALDALSNPVTAKHLKDMGISVKNAAGEFRPVTGILSDMAAKLDNLTGPQRAKALQAIFLGAGGTIQARRFLDPAIKNIDEFQKRVAEMKQGAGSTQKAYQQMAKTPAMQAQLLANRWKILEKQIGNQLIPVLLWLVRALGAVVKWFEHLSPTTKKWIVWILAGLSAFMALAGIVMIVVGAFIVFDATLTLLGLSLGVVVGIAAAVVAAIIAVGVALYFIIKYHNTIWQFIQKIWDDILQFFVSIWQSIWGVIGGYVKAIWAVIVAVFNVIVAYYKAWGTVVWAILQAVWWVIYNVIWKAIQAIWNVIVKVFTYIWHFIVSVWNMIRHVIGGVLYIIYQIIRIAVELWYRYIRVTVMAIWVIMKRVWGYIKVATLVAWTLIKQYIIQPMQVLWNWLQPKIAMIWSTIISPIWDKIKSGTKTVWGIIKDQVLGPVKALWDSINKYFNLIVDKITGVWDRISGILSDIGSALSKINPLQRNSPSLVDKTIKGYASLNRVQNEGLQQMLRNAQRHSDYIHRALDGGVTMNVSSNLNTPAQHATSSGPASRTTHQQQSIVINTEEINPAQHAAELGWQLMQRTR